MGRYLVVVALVAIAPLAWADADAGDSGADATADAGPDAPPDAPTDAPTDTTDETIDDVSVPDTCPPLPCTMPADQWVPETGTEPAPMVQSGCSCDVGTDHTSPLWLLALAAVPRRRRRG